MMWKKYFCILPPSLLPPGLLWKRVSELSGQRERGRRKKVVTKPKNLFPILSSILRKGKRGEEDLSSAPIRYFVLLYLQLLR